MQPAVQDHRKVSNQGQSALALSARKDERLKDALVALSIANLCFLHVWTEVGNLASEPLTRYYETAAPKVGYVWAVVLDVLALAAVLFGALLLRRLAMPALRLAGTAILAFFSIYAIYDAGHALHGPISMFLAYYGELALKLALILAVLYALFARRWRAFEIFRNTFFITSPLFFIMLAFNLWAYQTNALRTAGKGSAAGILAAPAPPQRVIWIIFDELDNRLLFQKRPARLKAPEFDRLRSESLYAGRVRTPAPETLEAIPSMLIGKVVERTRVDTSKLSIQTENDARWTNFKSQENVFRRARSEGFNTALSGWHHPYCRILGSDLSQCAWDSSWLDVYFQRHLRQLSLLPRALSLAEWQSHLNPFLKERPRALAPDNVKYMRENNIAVLHFVEEHGRNMLQNHALNFVLLHYPIPHPPGIWDSAQQKFTTGKANYIDNLALTDRVLGTIRRDLEATGDWDKSAVLVTGDHPLRAPMWLAYTDMRTPEMQKLTHGKRYPFVPFLLKLPGQHAAVSYTNEFNNLVSGDLLLDILRRKVTTPDDAIAWLNQHADDSGAE